MWQMFALAAAQGVMGGLQQRKQTKAENKAKQIANTRNTLEAFQAVSSIEVMRGGVRQQTAKTMALAERRAGEEASGTAAVAAASGVKGASVDAVQDDIGRALGEAIGETEIQHINQEYNLNQQIRSLMVQTRFNLLQEQKVPSALQAALGGAMNGLMQAGQTYASSYFKFGGSTPASSPNMQGQTRALTNNTAFVKNM